MVHDLFTMCQKLCRTHVRWPLMRSSAFWGALACLLAAMPSVSYADRETPDYLGDIMGNVSLVNDDGSLILTNGTADPLHIALWGLTITDTDGMRSFLGKRLLECRIVHELGPIPEADCSMYPNKDGGGLSTTLEIRGPISMFDWIPELGFATQECPHFYGWYKVSDKRGLTWSCRGDGTPRYDVGGLQGFGTR
jgi:hypothetical protein